MPLSEEIFVIPTKGGIHYFQMIMDSCLRKNDIYLNHSMP